MVDEAFADARLAALYDALNPWGPSDSYYLSRVLGAASAVDVGCGTGTLLAAARSRGHAGALYGVDPAPAMLAIARARSAEVAWVAGDAASFALPEPCDVAVMTGHAFQVLLTDGETVAALANVARHLRPGGRFVFETRNPAARAWERWTPALSRTTAGACDVWHDAVDVRGDLVSFVTTFRSAEETLTSASTLRFPDPEHVYALLESRGFAVEGVHGDWTGAAFGPGSPEVIVTAVR